MDSNISPFMRQMIVASSSQIAAISSGAINAFPAVLINQLKNNSSSIVLDLDSTSWVASIHGFAGIPSVILPTLMQWKGRRFGFITASLAVFLGWLIIYFAKDVKTILIGESFHGFGLNSSIIVSLSAISEMVETKYRNISMMLFLVLQILGLVIVTYVGYFITWQSVCLLMSAPIVLALLFVFLWPESPTWLACKGDFENAEKSFILLRGTDQEATKELKEIFRLQRESMKKIKDKNVIRSFLNTIRQRDFYIPNILMILIFTTYYWSGPLVVYIYAVDIIETTSKVSDFTCFLYMNSLMVIFCLVCVIASKYFKNKSVILFSSTGMILSLLLASASIYYKDFDIFPKVSLLLCILSYVSFVTMGNANQMFSLATEIIPVKHRGILGALYLIYTCLFHSVTLKVAPYLFVSIGVSGTFILFAVIATIGTVLIQMYVPETKDKTLIEIENHYNCNKNELKLRSVDNEAQLPLNGGNA